MAESDSGQMRAADTGEYDVVIIGAGFAGMYALHKLRGEGNHCRVFERGTGVDLPTFAKTALFDPLGIGTSEWARLPNGEKPAQGTPKAVHFTRGGPWFPQWQNVDYGDLWRAEHGRAARPNPG